MSAKEPPKAGELLHLRSHGLAPGEPVAPPLVQASMYHLPGDPVGVAGYGRTDNATWEATEAALAHLEAAPVVLFPSGMAAISAALFAVLRAGDRVLMPSDGYYTTRLLGAEFLAGLGVEVVERPTEAFAEGGFADFRVVFIETPSNPGLDMIDIASVAAEVRAAGGVTIVDNTTMTPLGQRPLALGADVVVASDTKAPGGHSDVLMGHVASWDEALLERVRLWRKLSGGIPGPMEAWLLHRGLETLEVRFARMCDSAEVIAARLAEHDAVVSMRYPGLASDPAHELAARQMIRFGFLCQVTFGSVDAAERFILDCPLVQPATSFGGVHTSAERRVRWGDAVDPASVRLAIGCEPVEELWAAMAEVLK